MARETNSKGSQIGVTYLKAFLFVIIFSLKFGILIILSDILFQNIGQRFLCDLNCY